MAKLAAVAQMYTAACVNPSSVEGSKEWTAAVCKAAIAANRLASAEDVAAISGHGTLKRLRAVVTTGAQQVYDDAHRRALIVQVKVRDLPAHVRQIIRRNPEEIVLPDAD